MIKDNLPKFKENLQTFTENHQIYVRVQRLKLEDPGESKYYKFYQYCSMLPELKENLLIWSEIA